MDSEAESGSDDSLSISDSSGDSSSQDEDLLEPVRILGNTLELPQDVCENPDIFKEIFSMKTWNSLSETNILHLKKFLPSFDVNDDEQKKITLQRLFGRENFNFSSPLVDFYNKLRDGELRPDIARMQKVLQKARRQHNRHQWKLELQRRMQEVLVSREWLLTVAHGLPPGAAPPRPPPLGVGTHTTAPNPLLTRTKRRYFQELAAIRSEVCGEGATVSEDENFPEGPPPPPSKNHRKQFMTVQGGADPDTIISTLGPTNRIAPNFSEEWRRKALVAHRRRKQTQPESLELVTTGITLASVRGRLGPGGPPSPTPAPSPPARARRPPRPPRPPRRAVRAPSPSSSEAEGPPSPPALPVRPPPPPPPPPRPITPVQIKVEHVPPEETVVPLEAGVELVQETHACFLSVVRDLVCGTPHHCLPLPALALSLRHWRQNPIAPLNHWYSLVEDWLKALPSAVSFLAGDSSSLPEDFVPYLQYKPATQMYQWIGAGRDSDALLTPLCTHWLAHRQAPGVPPPPAPPVVPVAPPPTVEAERPSSPPLSKWNSRWQVSGSELEAFRVQERSRFQRPHRAFTYKLPRGRAVVGPLKGVYACEETGGGRGARGHSLLAPSRPRHVTLLALVRDAVACLPGGEGTRAHITALLRRSQYLVAGAGEQALQAAVSGALDRMHGAPDPCVRYLPARKLWLYLHRDRTEEEFERLHAEVQVQGKTKSTTTGQAKRSAAPSKPRARLPKTTSSVPLAPLVTTSMETEGETEGEDAPVDVEGPEPVPQLLPAQVLEPPPPQIPPPPSAPPQAPPLVPTEKVNMVAVTTSSSSLLQPRATVLSSTIVRQAGVSSVGARGGVVRVLSPAAALSGKSLISPRAFRPSTSPPGPRVVTTQAKVVLQRPATQTTGALSPAHQRILLESLMQHQRTHGQPMSRDQLLHTIHSTQKMSSSPPVTPGTSPAPAKVASPALGQTIQLAGQTVHLASGQTVQLAGQTVQLTGQTVQLTGQTVQLGGQTVQLAGQTVQLGGQTVQLGGQTVQLGGQAVQLTGQQTVRPTGETAGRGPTHRQNAPLVAKILTNAQVRSGSSVGSVTTSRMTGSASTPGSLRVTGLSLGQLQGKPVLLHTSSANATTSNLILQTSGNSATAQGGTGDGARPPTTTQHTLLLSNLGGQVVRVASGGGTLLGPALRLQAASPASPIQGRSNNTGVLLGGQALKLQASPIRLHQSGVTATGPGGTGRVLLASGARLHGLKLLPVHHPINRGGGVVGNRQVYARIVNPTVGGSGTATVGLRTTTPASPAPPTAPATPRNQ